jgi:LuxR family maltose regulon positive regulatory protein
MQHRQNDPHPQSTSAGTFHVPAYKLTPPLSSSSQVPRTRVGEQIRQATDARLILVRAPAGFGKTTAMVQYHVSLREQGIATAWLGLDTADNDLGRFVADLAAAFSRIDPAIGSMAAATDVDGFTLDLINRIGAIDTRFVLFLDELEVIQNQTILDILRRMLLSLPPGGTVVAGSRDIPELGLGRLRAHGQLLEIGPASLRFSLDETTCLMRDKRRLALADGEIAKLQRCTEGWAAALQLAALSLATREDHKSFVASFSGSNADIADYLAEDVLARQSAEVRDFLLKTSILQQLSPPLCDAVTGRADSRDMLGRLDRGNLFLIPLDGERRWYRYHSIFADFLRTQLEQSLPDAVPDLHRRAAAWYAGQDRPVPAIEHALSSGAPEFALPLLERHAEHLLWQGRVRLLTRWMDSLPAASMAPYPKLRLVYAWALCLIHRYRDAMTQLDTIGGDARQDFEAQVMAVQTLALAMTDRADECYQHCSRIMEVLSSLEPFTYGVVANSMAYCLIAANQYGEARRVLDKAKHSHARLGATFSMAISESIEGVIDLLQGRLRSATACLRSAFSRAQAGGSGSIGGRATVGVLLALALYEADELAEAEKLLTECVPFIRQTGTPDIVIAGHLVLARLACQRGDRSGALQLMSDLEYLGHQGNLPRVVASAWLERCRMALQQGDMAAAQEYLQNADQPEAWQRFAQFSMHANDVDMMAIATARLMIRQGRAEQAIDLLKKQIAQAESVQRHRRALKLNILLAEAYQTAGQGKAALRLMAEALQFAGREGFIRTFIDEGPTVMKLVREVRSGLPESRAASASDIAPQFFDHLLAGDGEPQEPDTLAPGHALSEALTDREIQVLQLLAEGHPNRVLAERLFVSETTVKAHLRNINTKLAARNRTDAVAIARRVGLIRP